MKISERSGGNCSIPVDRRNQEAYWKGKRSSYALPTLLMHTPALLQSTVTTFHLQDTPESLEHILPPGQGLSRQTGPAIEQSRCPT